MDLIVGVLEGMVVMPVVDENFAVKLL